MPEADLNKLKSFSFEIGPIRPPSEGGSLSLLLRVTRNCPWSRCTFCYGQFYHRQKFELRPVPEVKAEIDTIEAITEEIKALSWQLGFNGNVAAMANSLPGLLLGGKDVQILEKKEMDNLHSVFNVYNWMVAGGKSVFLQDADTLIMHADQLVEILAYLKQNFPDIERVTSYARSKSLDKTKTEELQKLREAGLSRLHVGLETGDDELLAYVDKGVTSEEHIRAGRKAMAAGFELSLYVMPGLGGRAFWQQHALNTARVLNEINPNFIRMRPLVPTNGTPLLASYYSGEFELTTPVERLQELKLMFENLNVTSHVTFDHINNVCLQGSGENLIPIFRRDYNGYKFPEEKTKVLEIIEEALRLDANAFWDVSHWVGSRGI